MNGHDLILTWFLLPAVLIAILAFYIYRSSQNRNEDSEGMRNPLKKRFFFLILMLGLSIIFFSVTIPKSPYFLYAKDIPSKVIYANALQFLYILSDQEIDPETLEGSPSIEIQAGEIVEFRVTSLDVNHGFAIYNEKMELVTQTQAMPGYVNKLRWVFDRPGNYTILCLEYCGSGHAFMKSVFTVK